MPVHRDEAVEFERRVDAPFWAALGEGRLELQRCRRCRRWFMPADFRCGDCGSFDLDWEGVAPRGVVHSWIRNHLSFVPAYDDLVPYVNVLVRIPEAGDVRLLGLLVGETSDVRIGAEVTGLFEAPSERTQGLPALRWQLA